MKLANRFFVAGFLDGSAELQLCRSGLTVLDLEIHRDQIEKGRKVGREARRARVTGRNTSLYKQQVEECKRILGYN